MTPSTVIVEYFLPSRESLKELDCISISMVLPFSSVKVNSSIEVLDAPSSPHAKKRDALIASAQTKKRTLVLMISPKKISSNLKKTAAFYCYGLLLMLLEIAI